MDKIQKILVEAGHKDLAQEYYKKIAGDFYKEGDEEGVIELIKMHKDYDKGIELIVSVCKDWAKGSRENGWLLSKVNKIMKFVSRDIGGDVQKQINKQFV